MARYVVPGLCGLALLLVIAWFALRKTPPPAPDLPPIRAITVSPHAPFFAPDNAEPPEAPTNRVTRSPVIAMNAALIYGRASAIYDALSQEQKSLLDNWRTNVDSSVAAELCGKILPICELMHQATVVTNCDWGLGQPITFKTLLPHLDPCRKLARAAVWSAAHCRTGDPSALVADLAATSQLGQNASSSALIGHMIDLSMQQMVIDSVAEHASVLATAGDPRLGEFLNGASYDEALRRALEQEANILGETADRLAALPPEEAARELTMGNDSAQISSTGLAQYIAQMRQAAELQAQYAKASELTDAQYQAWLTNLDEAAKTNPIVAMFVSSLGLATDKTQAMKIRSAMAAAGLAVMQNGTDALQSHPDPTTGQPFAYRQTPNGFELESTFQVAQKPLSLSFK